MGVEAVEALSNEKGADEKNPVPGVYATPPEYRNDFLHAADVMEDVMIGRGLNTFGPLRPSDFTVGRLRDSTVLSRRIKELFTGLGYQEMIYNYLGGRRDLSDKCSVTEADSEERLAHHIVRISNPMTENYEYVRDSITPALLESESVSGNAAYPHRIYEIGKVAFKTKDAAYGEDAAVTGIVTRNYCGFMQAGAEMNYNSLAAELQSIFFYMNLEYKVAESTDPRFIPGRAASLLHNSREIGVFGEVHPQILENWGITVPVALGEIDLDFLI
jgi:phenylalanyl-tRNA synthetase beta chain